MNELVKSALYESIRNSLQFLHQLTPQYTEPSRIWKKEGERRWRSQTKQHTSVRQLFHAAATFLQKPGADFIDRFLAEYPEYGKDRLVGLSGMVSMQLAWDKVYILQSLLNYLWEKYNTFDCSDAQVEGVVSEFAEFIDSKTIRVRFWSQILNFRMPESKLQLTDDLTIRMLSEREISNLYGGTLCGAQPWGNDQIHEFVIEGELDVIKTLSGNSDISDNPVETVRRRLNQAVRCLRTFKEGRVGIHWCHFRSVKFCPIPMGSHGLSENLTSYGDYVISEDEVSHLQVHARNIIDLNEPALEMACARLSDAEARDRYNDQILDAVIGMETILLAGLENSERRSELKFRFSLNYSTLFDSAEKRWAAYKVAKDLYDLRSTIAHGSSVGEKVRIGAEKLTLPNAATKAKESLRGLIKHFLVDTKSASYKKALFWESGYFGLPDLK